MADAWGGSWGGSLAGTVPAPADVRAGVAVGFTVGTLVIPAPADVRAGVLYGAGGVEFVGTYGGAVVGADWLQQACSEDWVTFDTPRTITLRARSEISGGSPVLTTIANAQREATTAEDLAFAPALLNKRSAAFNVWRSKLGSAAPPKEDDVIDDGSVRWKIVLVQVLDEEQRYRCLVIRER